MSRGIPSWKRRNFGTRKIHIQGMKCGSKTTPSYTLKWMSSHATGQPRKLALPQKPKAAPGRQPSVSLRRGQIATRLHAQHRELDLTLDLRPRLGPRPDIVRGVGFPKKFVEDLKHREVQIRSVLENVGFGPFHLALEGIVHLIDRCVTHGMPADSPMPSLNIDGAREGEIVVFTDIPFSPKFACHELLVPPTFREYPTMMPSIPSSTYILEHYPDWMNERDADSRKTIHNKDNAGNFVKIKKIEWGLESRERKIVPFIEELSIKCEQIRLTLWMGLLGVHGAIGTLKKSSSLASTGRIVATLQELDMEMEKIEPDRVQGLEDSAKFPVRMGPLD
ncbi:hypothetical protein Cgig2_014196 [Carnegiea gigantea]|uniref:Uncharacterized protein n=1 Tax=Carnegiea gigantea TaxID=171969 RepID=A0A9Q1Q8X3_9CARY|nr:hypothetical protein Cgig2_014196 [Carnegiea gigantea]